MVLLDIYPQSHTCMRTAVQAGKPQLLHEKFQERVIFVEDLLLGWHLVLGAGKEVAWASIILEYIYV